MLDVAPHDGGAASPVELIGQWRLIATTSGYFTFRERVDSADFTIGPIVASRVRFEVRFDLRGKQRTIKGSVSAKPTKNGRYRWRGTGALLLVSRSQWSFALIGDERVAALINPGSMMTEPGGLILRRVDFSPEGAKSVLGKEFWSLGLDRSDYRELAWRE